MKAKEVIRWGVPTLAFLIYFKWGGMGMALLLWGILFAVISGFIHWHTKDPAGFFRGMRAWIVLFLILPAIALNVFAAFSWPLALVVSVPILLGVLWVYRRNTRKLERHLAR